MKVRKNISLEENILEIGIKNAERLGLNFSSYITMLINQDAQGTVMMKNKDTEESIDHEIKEEVTSSIDNILEM